MAILPILTFPRREQPHCGCSRLGKLPLSVIADRSGVHRSTIWRWKRKWHKLNEHRQLTNDNRTSRIAGTSFRWADAHWNIPTESARPHGHPKAITAAVV